MFMNKNQWSGKCVNATKFSWENKRTNKNVFYYFFVPCTSQLDWQRSNEIKHDIHPR